MATNNNDSNNEIVSSKNNYDTKGDVREKTLETLLGEVSGGGGLNGTQNAGLSQNQETVYTITTPDKINSPDDLLLQNYHISALVD